MSSVQMITCDLQALQQVQVPTCYNMLFPLLLQNCLVAGLTSFVHRCRSAAINLDLLVRAVLQGQMSHVHLEHKDQGGLPLLRPTDSILGLP